MMNRTTPTMLLLLRRGRGRPHHWTFSSASKASSVSVDEEEDLLLLFQNLRKLDTASLCDADKAMKLTMATTKNQNETEITETYTGLRLMNNTIRPMNSLFPPNHAGTMVGRARTVQFTERNDFLPVLRAVALEAKPQDVIVVNTLQSTRAVAGELFVTEARAKQVAGIIIDGPIRDVTNINITATTNNPTTTRIMRLYGTSITPYSGTTNSPGIMQPQKIVCGGIQIHPGTIIVGDHDGVIVGEVATFITLLPLAQQIQAIEAQLLQRISNSTSTSTSISTTPTTNDNDDDESSETKAESLASLTNLHEHVQNRLNGNETSNLEFRL